MKIILSIPIISLTIFSSLGFTTPPTDSPFAPPSPSLSGQIRTRTEYDQKAMRDTSANKAFFNTQIRSRLGFTAAPSPQIGIKLEVQDTRFMGSEPPIPATNPAASSVGNNKGIDLLQGYATVTEGAFTAAIGRQKMSLGAGRFLSTLEWSPTSRAFDGFSFNCNAEPGNLTGLVYLVRDSAEKATVDRLLLTGLYYNRKLTSLHQGDIFIFYDQSRLASTYGGLTAQNYDLIYVGERLAGKFGSFVYEEEFIWQGGEFRSGRDLTSAAFQLSTRFGSVFGPHKMNLGVDILSGDDDPSDNEVSTYRANYYFAHAYYGWMDYFTANPKFGVIDLRIDGDFAFLPGASGTPRVSVKPQYHNFLPQKAPSSSDEPYGQEFDLEVNLAIYPKANIVLGGGIFLPSDGAAILPAAALGPNQDYKPGFALYLMPTFNF